MRHYISAAPGEKVPSNISKMRRLSLVYEIARVIALQSYICGTLLQYNLNGSNPDGSFTLDDSNSFFSPYKILPIAQENKYLGIFSYFIMELYVVCTHKDRLIQHAIIG